LLFSVPATDFTKVGASANTVGLNFTASSDMPEWGNGGQLFEWRATTTVESDFTKIGASQNSVGEAFAYNGAVVADTSTPFSNLNDAGGTIFAYKREVLSAEYAGSSSKTAEYFIAENIKMSPNASPSDTKKIAELLNALITLRDAYQMLADRGADATSADKFAARDRVESAAKQLDDSHDDVSIATANLEMNKMALSFAKERDDMIHKNLNDMVSANNVADSTETITNLNRASSAFQAAIASSSRLNGMNLLAYL
jgi:flagellin-like hook-associated protein FlgL